MQKVVASVWWAWYVVRMTTTTCPATEISTTPCRCGHFDRTIRHSCRLARALAAHREAALTAVRAQEARLWDDMIDWSGFDFERFVAHTANAYADDEDGYYIEDEDGDRAYAEMLERRAEAGTWWGRD